ncbi:ABC-ATPase domain-containing protein [Thermosulfuriphilus sp.]
MLRNISYLKAQLSRLDGRGYKAYRDLEGGYILAPGLCFFLDRVQGDPFATPSRARIRLEMARAAFPEGLWKSRVRRVALQDYLLRAFARELARLSRPRGTGGSGLYRVDAGAQEVIYRSGCLINEDFVEMRFFMGLPAAGRRILGQVALSMILEEIPQAARCLRYSFHEASEVEKFVDLIDDIEYIRSQLEDLGLVAFVGNGAILPRRSGVDDRPLEEGAVAFRSPPELEITVETKYHGSLSGMGLPQGVTLIVGGGFHGKTTLLEALSRGIYPHIPQDGRQWVVTHPRAVKVRSEDGRYIAGVDISPFIVELPMGRSTTFFSTEDASGSTSLAASIMEALEMGARVLLIDEDTAATNFLIRDARMQALIPREKEPIIPFVDKVRLLYRDYGVSTILVLGGSGDYLDVADRVIALDNYRVYDLTTRAKEIGRLFPSRRQPEGGETFGTLRFRSPRPESFRPRRGRRERVKSRGLREILFGEEIIDVSLVEQLVDDSQARAIAEIIRYYGRYLAREGLSLREGLETILTRIEKQGLDILTGTPAVDLALPRGFEVAAAINRLRSLKVRQLTD